MTTISVLGPCAMNVPYVIHRRLISNVKIPPSKPFCCQKTTNNACKNKIFKQYELATILCRLFQLQTETPMMTMAVRYNTFPQFWMCLSGFRLDDCMYKQWYTDPTQDTFPGIVSRTIMWPVYVLYAYFDWHLYWPDYTVTGGSAI